MGRSNIGYFRKPNHPLANYKPKVVQQEDPEAYGKKKPTWVFKRMDREGCWALNLATTEERQGVFSRLSDFEGMTWNDIFSRCNNENHKIDVEQLTKKAQDRMRELGIFEDRIVSLRVTATRRVYGLLYGSVCALLWYDNQHGDNEECVCRSHKRFT